MNISNTSGMGRTVTTFSRKLRLAVLSVLAVSNAVALDGPGREVTASNVVRISSDTERAGFTYTKRFYVPYPGTVRVRWDMKTDSGGTAKVEVSGLGGNCPQMTTTSTSYKTRQCTLSVLAGDRIDVRVAGTLDGNPLTLKQGYIRNVQLLFNIRDSAGAKVELD